jgi:F-type H+-transporting ATPase subunit gamma
VANTLDIRRRIRSVKNTQQITRAMKMVAAAKLRRAQARMIAARPYSAALGTVLRSVAARVDASRHPLLAEREENRVLLLVITSDKGLAGAFNANVLKATQRLIEERGWTNVQIMPIGKKAADYFKRRTIPIRHRPVQAFQALTVETARELATVIREDFVEGKVDAVYASYNEFRSVISQAVHVVRLLPIPREEHQGEAPAGVDYLYEPGPERILSDLLPRYVEFQIYRALLESAAAEQGARMTAMEAASKNAAEMIDRLTLAYNRIRQAAITKEIIEIVSGAAALD